MADHDPTVYDARYQVMEEVHFDWRLCVALLLSSPNIWSFNTFLALIVSIMTLMDMGVRNSCQDKGLPVYFLAELF